LTGRSSQEEEGDFFRKWRENDCFIEKMEKKELKIKKPASEKNLNGP
jgi:hypothetical protein